MKRIGTVELSRESDVAREIIKDFNDAIKRFSEQAQTVSQQNDNNNGLYKARYNLGVFLRNIGELEDAADELKKAYDQGEKPSACN